jgi:hypothetical protein
MHRQQTLLQLFSAFVILAELEKSVKSEEMICFLFFSAFVHQDGSDVSNFKVVIENRLEWFYLIQFLCYLQMNLSTKVSFPLPFETPRLQIHFSSSFD